MGLDRLSCYRALKSRDQRFDGTFFTCVTSTGIYCRPICPARPPKLENCRFVATASAAQEAGFRACLRCRPDTAPGSPVWAGTSTTATRALRLISDGALDAGASVEDLAARLGVGERHLRRLFADHLGASPVTFAATRRILLAKQLVHDSALGMADVALASGFGSLRRFNEVFLAQYGRPPSALRRRAAGAQGEHPGLVVRLPYRPPYDWDTMLRFLGVHAIPGVERVESGVYARTITISGQKGQISVSDTPAASALEARIRIGDLSLVPRIVARLKRLFDVDCDPHAIKNVLEQDPLLAPLLVRRPGLRLPGAWDGFETGIRALLAQQAGLDDVSAQVGRIVERYGDAVTEPSDGLTHYFPSPDRLAEPGRDRGACPHECALTVTSFARALINDPGLLEGETGYTDVIARLTEICGVYPPAARWIAMRALQESDAIAGGNAIPLRIERAEKPGAMPADPEHMSQAWRPWRAYGFLHIWAAEKTPDDALSI